MASEVRKVLEREHEVWGEYSFFKEIANAERADAARREESVRELRRKVAELVARWDLKAVKEHQHNAQLINLILDDLNAIIATKPGIVENRQATASGPVIHESVWHGPYNVPPNGEIQLDEHIRAIAAEAVRDAIADAFRKHAEMLRNMPGAGHAAAVAAVSDAIGKACEADRKERGS